ncbi:MAG: hypothetical protein ACJ8D4_17755 [Xanthobacteraceae bacterium]
MSLSRYSLLAFCILLLGAIAPDGVHAQANQVPPPADAQVAPRAASDTLSLEQAKLDLERWRAEEDVRLKREELELKRSDLNRSTWSSPLLLAIIGVFASILVNTAQNFFQSRANINLERQRFESAAIQKAVETANKQDAADRLKFLLDLGLITDRTGKIASYVKDPETIPIQPPAEDVYRGSNTRILAKLSVGAGQTESFDDLKDLLGTLPADDIMASRVSPAAADGDILRVAEEQRNVRLRAFLYAAKKQMNNDYYMIIGRARESKPRIFMTAVVSGLPPNDSPSFAQLKAARDACKEFFGEHLPTRAYNHYEPPVPLEIEGSLLFDVSKFGGTQIGPANLRKDMKTVWQIRPLTKIVFES